MPRGGPSGGDGGHGGSVILEADTSLNTLFHLRFRSIFPGERGRHGEGSNCTGKSGQNLIVPVPLGTQVRDLESGDFLGEVLEDGDHLVVAKGGRGGRGNARFTSSTNRAPRRADPGQEGEDRRLAIELKLLADVGLVGLPNAGKSTLISVLSAARPKIADYPFTTLVPQLGVVADGPLSDPFVVADLPGLIAGAAQGAGLGHAFLRHVERCRVLVHLVDLSGEGSERGSAVEDLVTIEEELRSFDPFLLHRSRILVGSKMDAAEEERSCELKKAAEERDLLYLELSSATHEGLEPLKREIRQRLAAIAEAE